MPTPLTITATMVTPPLDGQPDCPFPVAFMSQYDHLVRERLTLTGSGTKAVDFGSLTGVGAKAVIITVDTDASPAALPVNVVLNGGVTNIEVSRGGFLLYGSPVPTASGITSLSIVYTSAVKLHVWIFG